MTDVNFDVEKHIAENVIRHENVETRTQKQIHPMETQGHQET